jgi:polysaccharide export outer membrane protein
MQSILLRGGLLAARRARRMADKVVLSRTRRDSVLISVARLATILTTFVALVATLNAQDPAPPSARDAASATGEEGVTPPPGYVIGAADVLSIVFWRDKDMSGDVIVRPDGKISVPLLNEIQAAGLTPAELRERLTTDSKQFIGNPNITVVVKQINSRKVFITGEVAKPGPYSLDSPMTVLQLIALAGGLTPFADGKKIMIVRSEKGKPVTIAFNYRDVDKNLQQNILELRPGDTVVVR